MSIEIQDASYVYMKGSPYEKKALANITLKISSGEFVGIIGHTGSGKSTLVQLFNGLLKPTSGKVLVNGTDISGKNLKELRKTIGIVFQYPEHQLFEETVFNDIAFGPKKQGLSEEAVESMVKKAIEHVGLKEELLSKSPFDLSGGQKRRVAIAGVLAMDPDILVLDEPAAGLDPKGRDSILKFIYELHASTSKTIILISHSMEDIAKLVDRVIVMNDGCIEMDGNTKEIFKNTETLENIGLSAPQITYLMKKLKSSFPDINDNIFTVKEAKEEILKQLGRVSR